MAYALILVLMSRTSLHFFVGSSVLTCFVLISIVSTRGQLFIRRLAKTADKSNLDHAPVHFSNH